MHELGTAGGLYLPSRRARAHRRPLNRKTTCGYVVPDSADTDATVRLQWQIAPRPILLGDSTYRLSAGSLGKVRCSAQLADARTGTLSRSPALAIALLTTV